MVLQTGQEITELDSSGFATQAPTISAGNMAAGRFIVQVSPQGRVELQERVGGATRERERERERERWYKLVCL